MFQNTSKTDDSDSFFTSSLQSSSYSSINYKILNFCEVGIESPNKEIIFGIRDSIPIKLEVKSFVLIKALCKHKVVHNFQFPVECKIDWIIERGKEKGAFKIGHGIDAEYVTRDTGNCVVFYPELYGISNNPDKKNIKILLDIDQIGFKSLNNQEMKKKYFLNIDITISKKNFRSTCKAKISIHSDECNNITNYDIGLCQDDLENKIVKENTTNTTNLSIMEKKYDDNNFVSIHTEKSCNICDLRILFRPSFITLKLNISRSYLITSEILKLSTLITKNDYYDLLILTGSKYLKHRLMNISISPSICWTCNIGEFVCRNNGDSIIYNTPQESELSKGPVILTTYVNYFFNSNFNSNSPKPEKLLSFSLQKKIWLLRQPPVMGG